MLYYDMCHSWYPSAGLLHKNCSVGRLFDNWRRNCCPGSWGSVQQWATAQTIHADFRSRTSAARWLVFRQLSLRSTWKIGNWIFFQCWFIEKKNFFSFRKLRSRPRNIFLRAQRYFPLPRWHFWRSSCAWEWKRGLRKSFAKNGKSERQRGRPTHAIPPATIR